MLPALSMSPSTNGGAQPRGPTVGVQLLDSLDLPDHWTRLDEFEGSGYRRTVTAVSTAEGNLLASIYVLALD